MKFPFFASFIIFIIVLTYEIAKGRRKQEKNSSSFWGREAAANNTRRKPLDNLIYITIPFDRLPMDLLKDDEIVRECHDILKSLSDSPIVNFTGYTNTDLKLEYGAPNIELLTRYDQSYTVLVRTLQRWADLLYEKGYKREAQRILEFSISTDSDVSGSYKLLAAIYREEGCPVEINKLRERAAGLRSASSKIIVRMLQESDQ